MASTSECKLAVVGGGGVGKSALTIRFVQPDTFAEEYDPTIEDSYIKQVTIDSVTYFLEILDTAGQEEYQALRDDYMRKGHGFLLVFSIIERSTFDELNKFRDQILRVKDKDKVPMVMIGNKCDLEEERKVSTAEAKNKAEEWGIPFFEGSAKSRINVEESFYELVREVRKEKEQQSNAPKNTKKAPSGKKKKGCLIL
ncbi:hypothetical protein C9374_010929 [Naegleria lovaniensis]|uniref:Ras family small GTPase n=1 Tax=Naegleria lovaniensis TaxID=51637 RepID=A0AA88KF99_NAELO|nr:uncharacterized protein C9374_010929 [Naegleria lovaniensis]KAG2374359.1 hypothetical protein C9374_010929 [Naegleria lovaniensis]